MRIDRSIFLPRAARPLQSATLPRQMVLRPRAGVLCATLAALCGLLVLGAGVARAAGLECPETSAAVPNLLADSPQLDRMTSANTVDLANEINGLIARLQTEKPGISADEITNVLIAAFCPVVSAKTDLSAAEKWRLIHRFDTVLMQQISANTMPPGSQIIASVPLPPEVFRDLTTKAETAGQPPAQYMATILMKAAGR